MKKARLENSRAFRTARPDEKSVSWLIEQSSVLAGAGHAGRGAAYDGAFGSGHGARYGGTTRARARAVARWGGGYRVRRAVRRGAEQAATREQRVEQGVVTNVGYIQAHGFVGVR